jgi:hydroxyacylglutathione hydrolase
LGQVFDYADRLQDPEIQKATGTTDPVEIMTKLREMKNNFK